jgi:tetratricopeptide (TPR) repeat protein
MLQKIILAVLGFTWATSMFAADPKPPWQRLLTGEDATKALGLEKQIKDQEKDGQYSATIPLHEELFALRARVQGTDHWETISEQWALKGAKKVAALPEADQAGWQKAQQAEATAVGFEQKAQFTQAVPGRQERLKWCRQILGEDHPYTSWAYLRLAVNLEGQGKYVDGLPMLRRAIDICDKTLGDGHPDTAVSFDRVGMNLFSQGKLAEAGPFLRKGLQIRRNVLGEDNQFTPVSYNNVALNLQGQGKYTEALPLFERALEIRRKVYGDDSQYTAASYNNLATILKDQGKFAEAEPFYQKSIDTFVKILGENNPNTASSFNNAALNLVGEKNLPKRKNCSRNRWRSSARPREKITPPRPARSATWPAL